MMRSILFSHFSSTLYVKLDSAAKKSITDQPCVAIILSGRVLHLHITEEMKHKTAETMCVGCLHQKNQ